MPLYSPISTTIKYGKVVANSTAQLLKPDDSSGVVGKGATVRNCSHLEGQTGKIVYVGDSTVTAYNGSADRATDGFPLGPGDSLNTSSLAEVWVVCNGSDTCWTSYFEDKA